MAAGPSHAVGWVAVGGVQFLRFFRADVPPKTRSRARSGSSLDRTRLPVASRPTVYRVLGRSATSARNTTRATSSTVVLLLRAEVSFASMKPRNESR